MGDVIIDGLTGANRLVVLDTNGKIPALDGSLVTAIAGANFSSGTIPVARIDTGTAAGKVVKLDGNAKLPAVSGAALTGVAGATKNASDPTISTNPSGGVGTEWQNTTSGEVYVCTDATAGENVWTNVGGQSGDVEPFSVAGLSYGYCCGGYPYTNVIDKTSFTSDGNSTDAGDLLSTNAGGASSSNGTYGWIAGGGPAPYINTIQKFLFATDANTTDHADLTLVLSLASGCNNADYGYAVGGLPTSGPTIYNIIQRYPFASATNATDVGDLTLGTRGGCGMSSGTHGFSAGGENDGPTTQYTNVIGKFSFASATEDAVDHGDLYTTRKSCAGNSSTDYGFVSAGSGVSGVMNSIDRFAYASNTTATDWADMTESKYVVAGTPSTTYGYQHGGWPSSNTVAKFPYASQTNATDVGDLTAARMEPCGTQY